MYTVEKEECITEKSPGHPYYDPLYAECDSKFDLEGEELFDLDVYD